ncbi:MAG: hypothetical protein R3A80_03815 [Bdellovibrionota bacterium]
MNNFSFSSLTCPDEYERNRQRNFNVSRAIGSSSAQLVPTNLYISISGSSSTLVDVRHYGNDEMSSVIQRLFQSDVTAALQVVLGMHRTNQLSSIDATTWLFPFLSEQDLRKRDLVYSSILQIADPLTLAELFLKTYADNKPESLLTMTCSLLADLGSSALTAYEYLIAQASGREIEYYITPLANEYAIQLGVRKRLLHKLATNGAYSVKESLLDNIDGFSEKELQKSLLTVLSRDSDINIKNSATDKLTTLVNSP